MHASRHVALLLIALGAPNLGCGSSEQQPQAPAPTPPTAPPATSMASPPTAPATPPEALPPSAGAAQTRAFRPDRVEPTAEHIASLRVPQGFNVGVYATELKDPRMMALAPDGSVWVTERAAGRVTALVDQDGDGVAEARRTVVDGVPDVHGIAIRGDTVYLAQIKTLQVGRIVGGKVKNLRPLVTDLPDGGQHPNRTVGVGPTGELLVSIGSSCNACTETNPEHATILSVNKNGKSRVTFASGLRNTIGFDWHPSTGQLWGMDHGIDHRGDDTPPEELNRLEEGKHYGWPFVYGKNIYDEFAGKPPKSSKEEFLAKATPAVLTYQAHSAPIAMVFYDGKQFPSSMQGDAFVAMHGSWNRVPATGYEVVRVKFDEGEPTAIEPFVTGFLLPDGRTHFGRPAGLVVARDGALLVGDDANGRIYRIAAEPVASR